MKFKSFLNIDLFRSYLIIGVLLTAFANPSIADQDNLVLGLAHSTWVGNYENTKVKQYLQFPAKNQATLCTPLPEGTVIAWGVVQGSDRIELKSSLRLDASGQPQEAKRVSTNKGNSGITLSFENARLHLTFDSGDKTEMLPWMEDVPGFCKDVSAYLDRLSDIYPEDDRTVDISDYRHAAEWADYKTLKSLLEHGADANAIHTHTLNTIKFSGLEMALTLNKPDVVRLYLAHGAKFPMGRHNFLNALTLEDSDLIIELFKLDSMQDYVAKHPHILFDLLERSSYLDENLNEIIKILHDHGADFYKKDGFTHLYGKVFLKKRLDILQAFIANGLDINHLYDQRDTLLSEAIRSQRLEWVVWLLENGAKIGIKEQPINYHPWILAHNQGTLGAEIKNLIEKQGFNAGYSDRDGTTLLEAALAQKFKEDEVVSLFEKTEKKRVAQKFSILLERSLELKYSSLSDRLIEAFEPLPQDKIEDRYRLTMRVFELDRVALFKRLTEKGFEYPQKDNLLGLAATTGAPKILRYLIQSGHPSFKLDNTEPLFEAINYEHTDCLKILLEAGFDANSRNSYDCPALILAIDRASVEMFQTLMDAGADLSVAFKGWSLIHCVANVEKFYSKDREKNRIEIARKLIAAGTDINAKTDAGLTTFDLCVSHGYEELAIFLLENGAKVTATSDLLHKLRELGFERLLALIEV
jgi:ankyrin repeat protein